MRKRAIVTLSHFVPLSAPELSGQLLSTVVIPNLQTSAPIEKQRTTVNLVAAIVRASPQRLASGLGAIVPGIQRVVDQDDEELREGALQVNFSLILPSSLCLNPSKALESIVLRMPAEVTPFLSAIIQVAAKYIKFDPVSTFMRPTICVRLIFIKNYAGGGDDEDEEMLDEDDEDEGDLDEYVNCRYSPIRCSAPLGGRMKKTNRTKFVALPRNFCPLSSQRDQNAWLRYTKRSLRFLSPGSATARRQSVWRFGRPTLPS